jgi:ketosteroid isomerase-like protein
MIAELLNTYYEGTAKKGGWEKPLSDTIRFVSRASTSEGKAAFVEATTRFLRAVNSAARKEILIDGDAACVWVNYELVSPKGSQTKQDVLEIWTERDGQLTSCTIYFDTAAFRALMAQ